MKIHELREIQRFPITRVEAWKFFSDPKNLALITPKSLGFQILGDIPATMHAGMILRYSVTPMFGFKMRWVSEITHVDQNNFFVDEQRFGPYAFWHHKHFLRDVEGGVEVEDFIHYGLPYGPLGNLFGAAFVRARLKEIFDFRRQTLINMFGQV